MTTDLLAFIAIAIVFIAIPGPNVMVIVATSLRHGRHRGLQTVAGTSAAMLVQLAAAGLGTTLLVSLLVQGLVWLKWAGVVYLIYLGLRTLLARPGRQVALTGAASFQRGFWISLTNPKTILFFAAFLPQFVTSEGAYAAQIVTLSLLFWSLALLLDSAYALLAAAIASRLGPVVNQSRWQRLSGVFYLGAGVALASSSRN